MKTVLCYGDSNTYGYDPVSHGRYPKNIRWTGRLAALLGDGYEVVEEGCNGRTTVFHSREEGWKRGLDYLRPCLNSHKPVDIVILMLGSNDLKKMYGGTARTSALGAERLVREIKSFAEEKQSFCPEIILVSPPRIGEKMKIPGFGSGSFEPIAVEHSKEFALFYRAIAERNGCIFADAAAIAEPSEEDALHLMPSEHEKLANAFYSIVKNIK